VPAGHHVAAVAVQVVIGAPPAHHLGPVPGVHLALLALAALAVAGLVVMVVVVVVVVVVAVPAAVHLGAVIVPLGRRLQGVGLGEELLDGVDEVADAAGALAAGLGAAGPRVLQRVEAVVVQRQLLLELVQQRGGQAVDLAGGVGGRHAFVAGVVGLLRVVHPREGAAGAGGGRLAQGPARALAGRAGAPCRAVGMLQGTRLAGAEEVWRPAPGAVLDVVGRMLAVLWDAAAAVAGGGLCLATLPMVALHGVSILPVASASCRVVPAGSPAGTGTALASRSPPRPAAGETWGLSRRNRPRGLGSSQGRIQPWLSPSEARLECQKPWGEGGTVPGPGIRGHPQLGAGSAKGGAGRRRCRWQRRRQRGACRRRGRTRCHHQKLVFFSDTKYYEMFLH